MTDKLETLTGKIDALRAKGFNDEEINALLSHPQTEVPESPFNIGEIFNNGASKEEWNKQVDETEQLYIKMTTIGWLCIGIGAIGLILGMKGYYSFQTTMTILVLDWAAGFLIMNYYAPQEREKIKFFIKKRR